MAEKSSESKHADTVFEEEQAHLSKTYSKLLEMEASIRERIVKTDADAAADKSAMMEDISPDFSSFDESLETFAAYETVNRVIDAYNISQETNARKLTDIALLLKQPYFAKISLKFKEGEDPKELYIGVAGISDENCRRMVVDWRSPVAEVYYNQENGATSYTANGRVINVDLLLRRQFDIHEDRLKAYFDTTVAIQDPLLLESLSARRSSHMQAITTTIQKEQNVVVRHDDVPALLVSGVAGSGKTSVLMQRIAYLFYQQRESLDPSQVYLLTPNPVFRRYIENVLPDMGESNPVTFVWSEFANDLMPAGRAGGKQNVPIEVLRKIDDAIATLHLNPADFKEISLNGKRIVTVNQVASVMAKFKNIPVGPRKITLVREELMNRLTQRIKRLSHDENMQNEMLGLPQEEQLRIFHETIDPNEEDELYILTLKYLEDMYASVVKAIGNDDWLRIDRIGMHILGTQSLQPVEWLYLKMALTGLGNPSARYVMVDEVQDYTPAQLMVLAKYFRRAHFLLLGDENQAIEPESSTFEQVAQVFDAMRGGVSRCDLMTSYRSTPQITALFSKLMVNSEGMKVESVQREDTEPLLIECADEATYESELSHAVKSAAMRDGITAIIIPWKKKAEQLRSILGSSMPDLVDDMDQLPNEGLVVLTLKQAKGLEFDQVIIPDASEANFRDDVMSRHRLYTTISRATKGVTIISNGKMTPLLA